MKRCKDCRAGFDPKELVWAFPWTNFMKGIGAWDSLCEDCLDANCEMLVSGFEGNYEDNRLLLAGLNIEISSRGSQRFSHRAKSELRKAVGIVFWYPVTAKQLADWLEGALSVEDIEHWITCEADHNLILSWAYRGLNLEVAQEWVDWGVSPTEARRLGKSTGWKSSHEGQPPSSQWRAYGFTLEDAMRFEYNGCDVDSLEGWSILGMTATEIINLQDQVIREYEQSPNRFDSIFSDEPHALIKVTRPSGFPFWDEVRESLEGLHEAKLPRTLTNVLNYGAMSGDQILSAIDSPEELSVSIPFAKEGLSSSEISTAARFVEKGFDQDEAITFACKGAEVSDIEFLLSHLELSKVLQELLWRVKTLTFSEALRWAEISNKPEFVKKLVESGIERDRFKSWKDKGYSLDAMLDFIKEGWNERDAASWVRAQLSVNDAAGWAQSGFSPKESLRWRGAGFSAIEASAWINTGVKDPEIAIRRRKAGIPPT